MCKYKATEICNITTAFAWSRAQACFGSTCTLLVLERHLSALGALAVPFSAFGVPWVPVLALGAPWVPVLALWVLAVPFSALGALLVPVSVAC